MNEPVQLSLFKYAGLNRNGTAPEGFLCLDDVVVAHRQLKQESKVLRNQVEPSAFALFLKLLHASKSEKF